jgi:hypothetical protein
MSNIIERLNDLEERITQIEERLELAGLYTPQAIDLGISEQDLLDLREEIEHATWEEIEHATSGHTTGTVIDFPGVDRQRP